MKYLSVNENHLYAKVYAKGKKQVMPMTVTYVLRDYKANLFRKQNPEKKIVNRIGLTVTKKIGGAVVRNRCKRIIREAYRTVDRQYAVKKGYLIIIVARERAVHAKTQAVAAELTAALKKLGMLSTLSTLGMMEEMGEPEK